MSIFIIIFAGAGLLQESNAIQQSQTFNIKLAQL
jgi:hypothetical protein